MFAGELSPLSHILKKQVFLASGNYFGGVFANSDWFYFRVDSNAQDMLSFKKKQIEYNNMYIWRKTILLMHSEKTQKDMVFFRTGEGCVPVIND